MAGGIGVTPLIAMAHRLHALGRDFQLHYSAASRATAGFLDDLAHVPWANRVQLHLKDEGGRADLATLVPAYAAGLQLYTCGSPRYMDAVFAAAAAARLARRRAAPRILPAARGARAGRTSPSS